MAVGRKPPSKQLVTNLYNAWHGKGTPIQYHDTMKRRLKHEWPVLYQAIEGLLEEYIHD